MKRISTILLAVLSTFSIAIGQTLTVRSSLNLSAVEGAVISQSRGNWNQITNARGQASLPAISNSDTLVITHIGFRTLVVSASQLEKMKNEVVLQPRVVSVDEVVISASGFEQRARDLTTKMEQLDATEIAQLDQGSTADLLSSTGNVFVQKSQHGGGSPVLRGFEANKILLVVDGVRMNNAIYRSGHLQNVLTIDAGIVNNMEVLYGPGTVMHGSDALGGVLSFNTRNPILAIGDAQAIGVRTHSRYATADNGMAMHADLNIGGKKTASLTSLSLSDHGNLRQGAKRDEKYSAFGKTAYYAKTINGADTKVLNPHPNVQLGSAYRQYDIFQKLLFAPTPHSSHILTFQHSSTSDNSFYARLTDTLSNGQLRWAKWYYGPALRSAATYHFSSFKQKQLYDQLKTIIAYQNIEESRHTRLFASKNLDHRIENVAVWSLNINLEKRLARHVLHYGSELTTNEVASYAYRENIITGNTNTISTRYPDGGSNLRTGALYLSHHWDVSPKLVVEDGVRFSLQSLEANFVDTTFFKFPFSTINQQHQAFTGQLGLVYKLLNPLYLVANISSGFRAPNVDDIAKIFESTSGKVILPNANLEPEQVFNFETGLRLAIKKAVKFDATFYQTSFTNVITTLPGTFAGNDSIQFNGLQSKVFVLDNAAEARLYGLEGKVAADFTKHASLYGSVAYTHGRIKTDTTDYPLDHIPPVYGKFGLVYTAKKLLLDANVQFNGQKKLKDYNLIGEDNFRYATADGMPAWHIFNLSTQYALNPNFTVRAALENIADKNYRVFASGISAPGRNFVLTLRGQF